MNFVNRPQSHKPAHTESMKNLIKPMVPIGFKAKKKKQRPMTANVKSGGGYGSDPRMSAKSSSKHERYESE